MHATEALNFVTFNVKQIFNLLLNIITKFKQLKVQCVTKLSIY